MAHAAVFSKTQFQRAFVDHKGREAKSLSYLVNKNKTLPEAKKPSWGRLKFVKGRRMKIVSPTLQSRT